MKALMLALALVGGSAAATSQWACCPGPCCPSPCCLGHAAK
jgi:hypothetical protein